MKYKLMITDYDGTLGEVNEIDKETILAIENYKKNGGKFVICTGRSFKAIEHICKKYNITGDIVCFQGALIKNIESGEILYDGGCNKADILSIKEKFETYNLACAIYFDEYAHYDDDKNEYLAYYLKIVGAKTIKVDNLKSFCENTNMTIRKIIALGKEEDVARAQRELFDEYNGRLIVNTSAPNLIEAVDPNNSKGEGVKRIAKHYGIPLNEVITVGDSLNDVELVRGEWHGVAVGDAVDGLKQVAKEIAVPFKEHPIKYLIEKYN